MSDTLSFSSWKYDREHYSQMAKMYSKLAILSISFSSIFWSIFILSALQSNFWMGGTLLVLLGILFLRLRILNLRNSFRAPSKI